MWFRVNDKFHSNAKIRKVRRSHPTKRRDASAAGLWFQAATWSADNKMDGFVPEEVVETFDDDWEQIAQRLVDQIGPSGLGLFEPAVVEGEPGWIVHDFLEFNDSREEQERDQYATKMRNELHRDPVLKAAICKRDKNRCRYCGTQVNWRASRGNAAATYDHIIPLTKGGKNTLENVVVCCKGCNDRKGKRTLKEAGMRLLVPGHLGAPTIDEDAPEPSSNSVRNGSQTKTSGRAEGCQPGSGRVGSGSQYELNSEVDDGDPDPTRPDPG